MSGSWHNRLTSNRRLETPDDDPLGLWVNDSNLPWAGVGDDAVGVTDDILPDKVVADGAVRVSESLKKGGVRIFWEWCTSLPVDMQLREAPSIRREERLLMEALPHFEEICRSPRAHLTVEEIREPVGRARRFPPRAVNVLASHSEDWHSRSLRSVRPKRVLAEVRADDFAIYENRALRTLRLHVLGKLAPRLSEIRDLVAALHYAEQGDVRGGRRFHLKRLCNLLAELFNENPDYRALVALLRKLERSQSQLLALESTFLLKATKGTPRVHSPLQSTNILREDHHYRHVWRTWQAWETRRKKKITRQQVLTDYCSAMDRFTALLCARALELIRIVDESVLDVEFTPGSPGLGLKHRWSIEWKHNGTILLKKSKLGPVLQVLGMPIQLGKMSEDKVSLLVNLLETQTSAGYSILLVCLGPIGELPESWPSDLRAKINDVRRIRQPLPGCHIAEVSPSRLDSIEMIARVIRRVVAEHDWPELPLSVTVDQRLGKVAPELVDEVHCVWPAPPPPSLRSRLTNLLNEATTKKERLETELERLQCEERKNRGARRGKNRVNYTAEKHRLREKTDDHHAKISVLSATRDQLDHLVKKIEPALTCPCCGQHTTLPPARSAFTCSRDSCGTRWGRRHNRSGRLEVFLWPDGEDPDQTKHPLQQYGADYI